MMKIVVDGQGWAVTEEIIQTVKPSSGVFPKTTGDQSEQEASSRDTTLEEARDAEIAQAPTEPCPTSAEATQQGSLSLPSPPGIPRDLLEGDGSKVA